MNQNAHSNFIGGSNAAARIACPASWQMEQKLPEAARRETSAYADDGSALHAAMACILSEDLPAELMLDKVFEPWTDYPITQEMIDTALKPCLDFFDALDDECGGLQFHIEKKVSIPPISGAFGLPGLPGVEGVFGTCDLIGKGHLKSVIVDWKFGVGVQVLAYYEDDDGFFAPNEQLMFYLLGAMHTYPEMFMLDNPDWPIEICIGQPRHRDGPNFDRFIVTVKDVARFQERLAEAARLAKTDSPPMAKGHHCRFMSCKSICPLHTGPLLEIPDLVGLTQRTQLEAAVGGEGRTTVLPADWDTTFSLMLDLAERVEPVLAEWRKQAQAHMESGGIVDGWKLVNRRANRKWVKTEKQVERRLARLGLIKDERAPRTLISPPQAEKLLKAKGKPLPAGYYDAISSGLTLAKAGDARQDVKPVGDLARSLAHALDAIRAGIMKPSHE